VQITTTSKGLSAAVPVLSFVSTNTLLVSRFDVPALRKPNHNPRDIALPDVDPPGSECDETTLVVRY
jgi:hypothetical protein